MEKNSQDYAKTQVFENILYPNIFKVLSLVDKNPISQSFGCFDRDYHHYKSKSFVNSMMQCYGMFLARIFNLKHESNHFYQDSQLKRIASASIKFTISSTRSDGSCDEHYLSEDSHVACVFSIISIFYILEEFPDIGLSKRELTKLERMINWADKNPEDSTIGNHIAATVLMLAMATKRFKNSYDSSLREWIEKLKNSQTDEGWTTEYNGCDPGYQTLTNLFLHESIRILSELKEYQNSAEIETLEDIYCKSAVFMSHLITPEFKLPDGFGSRNTSHLFISGFSPFKEADQQINSVLEQYFEKYRRGEIERIEDDRFNFFGLLDYSIYLSFELNTEVKQRLSERFQSLTKQFTDIFLQKFVFNYDLFSFPKAGIFILKRQNSALFIAANTTLGLEIYIENKLVHRHLGYSYLIQTSRNKKRFARTHETIDVSFNEKTSSIELKTKIIKHRKETLSPTKQIGLIVSGILAKSRIFKRLIKTMLIKRLILQKPRIIGSFYGKIGFNENTIEINNISLLKRRAENVILYEDISKDDKYVPSNGFYFQRTFLSKQIKYDLKIADGKTVITTKKSFYNQNG